MTFSCKGALAQLARASAWHAEGHRFEPDMLHHPNFQPAESTDSTGFLFPVQVPMGQRVAWALLRLFATPGDDGLATFAAARPEISAAVSVPDGRSPRFYAILSLGIFPRINASLFASRVPVAGLCLAVLRRTPRSRKLLFTETNLRFEYQPATTGCVTCGARRGGPGSGTHARLLLTQDYQKCCPNTDARSHFTVYVIAKKSCCSRQNQ